MEKNVQIDSKIIWMLEIHPEMCINNVYVYVSIIQKVSIPIIYSEQRKLCIHKNKYIRNIIQ